MNGNNKVIKIDEYEDIKNIALDVLLKGKPGSDGVCVINDLDEDESKIKEKLLSVLDDKLNILKPLFYVVDKCDIFSLKRIEKSDEPAGKTFAFSLLDFQRIKSKTYIAEIYITVPDDDSLPLVWDASEVEIADKNYIDDLFETVEVDLPKGNATINYIESGSSLYLDEIEPGEYFLSYTPQSFTIIYERGLGGVGLRGIQFANIHIYHNSKEDVPDGTVMASATTFINSVMQHSLIRKDLNKSVKLSVVSNGFTDIALNGYAQNITAVKTFKKLPQSDVVPVDNKDFTNKAYVDSKLEKSGSTIIYDWLDEDETIKTKLLSSLDEDDNLIKPLYLINDGVMLFTLADVDYTENGRQFRFKAGNLIDMEGQKMSYSVEIIYTLLSSGELLKDYATGMFFDNETLMQNVNDMIDQKITGVLESDY